LRQATKAIRVDVRIFKAGGSSRQFQTNNLRKCARCARYSPAEDFSELKVDDLLPVTIETDKDQGKKHRGICSKCAGTIAFVSSGDKVN